MTRCACSVTGNARRRSARVMTPMCPRAANALRLARNLLLDRLGARLLRVGRLRVQLERLRVRTQCLRIVSSRALRVAEPAERAPRAREERRCRHVHREPLVELLPRDAIVAV